MSCYKCRIVLGEREPLTNTWTNTKESKNVYIWASTRQRARLYCKERYLWKFQKHYPHLEFWKVVAVKVSEREGLVATNAPPLLEV